MATKKNTSSKITAIMTGVVLLGFAIILAMNVASMLGVIPSKYISPNDVSGIAVEHEGKLFTLNFAQQNELVDIFNRSKAISKENFEKRKIQKELPNFNKIIVYTFNEKNIEVKPIGYVSNSTSNTQNQNTQISSNLSMVYSAPDWNKDGFLEESSSNEMLSLLQSTYDH